MKGLMLAIGAKPDKDDDESDEDPARSYAREAFTAAKDGDEKGFIEALLSFKSCAAKKAKPETYEEDDEE